MRTKHILAYFVVLTSMAVSAESGAEPSPAASPWQETDLDFDFINERVNTTACQRSETTFLSCIGAVQSLLDSHGGRLRLVPARELLEVSKPAEIRKRFDKVAIVEGWGPRFLDGGNALALLRDRALEILRWREHYPVRSTDAVDFSAIRRWLLAEIVDHRRAADFAATAVNGYLKVSDAHARIVPAPVVRSSLSGRQGGRGVRNSASATYTGIGASIQGTHEAAIISSILRDGPAAEAGLRVQDVILAVDGELLTDMPPSAVVSRLRGPAGSGVTVTVKRQDKLKTFMVTRGRVSVKTVYASAFVDRGWEFGYVRIDSFLQGNTCAAVRRGLRSILKPALNGIILDLRDNAGGLIDQAVCVADMFLPSGEVVLEVREVDRPARSRRVRTRHRQVTAVPMVTLVNAATASASEVLAGALQDHGRSFVLGERTFGKGTVQTARPWKGSTSVLKMYTAARYYRPSSGGVQLVGIEPDLPALARPDAGSAKPIVLREEDLFPTALPPEPGNWIQPRPESVAALADCVSSEGLAEKRWKRDKKERTPSDHALLVAQDHLTCSAQRRIF